MRYTFTNEELAVFNDYFKSIVLSETVNSLGISIKENDKSLIINRLVKKGLLISSNNNINIADNISPFIGSLDFPIYRIMKTIAIDGEFEDTDNCFVKNETVVLLYKDDDEFVIEFHKTNHLENIVESFLLKEEITVNSKLPPFILKVQEKTFNQFWKTYKTDKNRAINQYHTKFGVPKNNLEIIASTINENSQLENILILKSGEENPTLYNIFRKDGINIATWAKPSKLSFNNKTMIFHHNVTEFVKLLEYR